MTSFWGRSGFALVTFFLQLLFLILFGIFATYDYEDFKKSAIESRWYYPMFQDVHVMIFIGFGFLMTFLKRYGYSAVGVTFLISALVIQWHIIFKGLIHFSPGHYSIPIGVTNLILADFTAAAILISFGAVIGKTSPLQLLIMAFFETVVFAINEMIAVKYFLMADIGGSMIIHVFGAYFGLAVTKVIYRKGHAGSPNEGASYQSDLFAMIGTIFLWLYWPSFNGGIATSPEQQTRAVVNTYLSLAACTLITFALSSLIDKEARFNMVHIQNATLAGGVAVGTAANFYLQPWGAVLCGTIAAFISVMGFAFVQPFLLKKIGLHDSCGVNNLHGMPGLFASIVGAVGAACATRSTYGDELGAVFPGLANSTISELPRTIGEQGGYQAATLALTLGLAIVGGLFTGLILRYVPGLNSPSDNHLFSDHKYFHVPDDYMVLNETSKEVDHPMVDKNGGGHDTKI